MKTFVIIVVIGALVAFSLYQIYGIIKDIKKKHNAKKEQINRKENDK